MTGRAGTMATPARSGRALAAVAGQLERGVRLQPNGLDVRAVDPRNGAKYSPNLHRWLTMRSKKHHAWTSRVYCDESGTTGTDA